MKIIFQTSLLVLLIAYLFAGCYRPEQAVKNTTKTNERKFTVALLPYKGFELSLLQGVAKAIEDFYKCRVVILSTNNLPVNAFYSARQRYKADSLLVFQKQLVKDTIRSVAGFTSKDISTSNGAVPDWGIFGLGYCPGKACIISSYRLQKASSNTAQLKERLLKVVLHELGHNLGLTHCSSNKECLLTDAGGSIKQVDQEKIWLCDHCKQILQQ
jgi:archaemetzincin